MVNGSWEGSGEIVSVWKKSKYKVFKGGRSWECLIMAGVAGAEILKRVRGGLRGNGDQIMECLVHHDKWWDPSMKGLEYLGLWISVETPFLIATLYLILIMCKALF